MKPKYKRLSHARTLHVQIHRRRQCTHTFQLFFVSMLCVLFSCFSNVCVCVLSPKACEWEITFGRATRKKSRKTKSPSHHFQQQSHKHNVCGCVFFFAYTCALDIVFSFACSSERIHSQGVLIKNHTSTNTNPVNHKRMCARCWSGHTTLDVHTMRA